jgi:hypothetical protein
VGVVRSVAAAALVLLMTVAVAAWAPLMRPVFHAFMLLHSLTLCSLFGWKALGLIGLIHLASHEAASLVVNTLVRDFMGP